MKITITRTVPVARSPRVAQLEGLFELPPTQRSDVKFDVDLPVEERAWNIGLIVGPSGSGKSTILREFFAEHLILGYEWPADASIVDAFPRSMGIKEITALLSSVGFSSPPNWLRPFRVLSTGEQFRVTIARALADVNFAALDEFTSVVDRTVARIGSAAVAKAIRQRDRRFVAASCHYDIIEWLQPDWLYDTAVNQFTWRRLQRRPPISLTVRRVRTAAWIIFKHHHYLDSKLAAGAYCFLASLDDRPVAFTGVLPFPHATRPGWREHRTVCLPDFQGVGIGNAMSAFVASLFKAAGKPYYSVTGNPAMIYSRARSAEWKMIRAPSRTGLPGVTSSSNVNRRAAFNRLTAGFEYVGVARPIEARRFGLI